MTRKKINSILVISAFCLGIFLLDSCKKDKEDEENKSPNCQIIAPANNSVIAQGETVTISVNASDDDGSINTVSIKINGDEIANLTRVPFSTTLNTSTYTAGEYTISASACDNDGLCSSSSITVKITGGSVANGDTIYPGNILNAQGFTLYELSGDSGYVVGTNAFNDKAKAQRFTMQAEESYEIKGGVFWFGFKNVAGDGNLNFRIWDMDGNTGITTQGENQSCPNTILINKSIPISTVDTASDFANAHVLIFDTTITLSNDYAMGFDMSNLTVNDEIGLVTSLDGDGNMLELTWELWSNGQWATLLEIYGADFDMAIFPLLAAQAANVSSKHYFLGMQMSVAPSKFSNKNQPVQIALEKNSNNVIFDVYNLNGKLLYHKELGNLQKGNYDIQMENISLNKGKYIYVLTSNNSKLAKEIIIY